MKKLISVFAALALVGSLAAQKGKKPAKAPAKPAVAAPAVPAAVTTAAAIAPAAKGGKGAGLTIQGYGLYALANGTSTAIQDGGNSVTGTVDTVNTYKLSNSSAFGGGAAIAYEIVDNLNIAASFDYRSFSTRKWSNVNAAASGGTATTQKTWNNVVIGLGLRPTLKVGPGHFYAGAGAALVLPYKETLTTEFSDPNSAANAFTATQMNSSYTAAPAVNNTKKLERVDEWNMAFGAYGELGYNFEITSNLFIGLGVKVIVATANNADKTSKTTRTGDTTSTQTTTYKTEYSSTQGTNEANAGTATDAKSLAAYQSNGITDLNALVSIGFRF